MRRIIIAVMVFAAAIAVNYLIWAHVVVPVFGAPPLTYWQVFLLWLMVRSLFAAPSVGK